MPKKIKEQSSKSYYYQYLYQQRLSRPLKFYWQYHFPDLQFLPTGTSVKLTPWQKFQQDLAKVKMIGNHAAFDTEFFKNGIKFKDGIHLIYGNGTKSLLWVQSRYLTETFEGNGEQDSVQNQTVFLEKSKKNLPTNWRLKVPKVKKMENWHTPTPINTDEQKMYFHDDASENGYYLPTIPQKYKDFFDITEIQGNYAFDREAEKAWFRKEGNQKIPWPVLQRIYNLNEEQIKSFQDQIVRWPVGERKSAYCLLSDLATELTYDNYVKIKSVLELYLDTTCSICKKTDATQCLLSIQKKVSEKHLQQEIEGADKKQPNSENQKFVDKPKEIEIVKLVDTKKKISAYCSMAFKLQEMETLKNKAEKLKEWYNNFTHTNLGYYHVEIQKKNKVALRFFNGEWKDKQHDQLNNAFSEIAEALTTGGDADFNKHLLQYIYKQIYFKDILEKQDKNSVGITTLQGFIEKFVDTFIKPKKKELWKNILNEQGEEWSNPSVQSWLAFDIGRFYCMWQIDQKEAKTWAIDPLAEVERFKFPSHDQGNEQMNENLKKYFSDNPPEELSDPSLCLMLSSLVKIEQTTKKANLKAFRRNSLQPHKITVISKDRLQQEAKTNKLGYETNATVPGLANDSASESTNKILWHGLTKNRFAQVAALDRADEPQEESSEDDWD